MRKAGIFLFSIVFSFGSVIGMGVMAPTPIATAEEREVYIGGIPAGFTLSAGGAQIIGVCEVIGENGTGSPAIKAGLKTGDIILKAAGITVETVEDLNQILAKNGEKDICLNVRRGECCFETTLCPIKDKTTGRYRIGILIRDSVSGIGTVTYIDKNTRRFGSLGHSVVGEDHREMKISGGAVYQCNIVGVTKGIRGRAGELRGMFLSDGGFGEAEKICDSGIYGRVSEEYDLNGFLSARTAEIDEVKIGDAYIYSTVDGICPKKYSVEIVKVDKRNKSNKNFVIKITDSDLIEETGGIVQGMSGSPILQEDKIVGAVTHVFLNDPTRGYGIDINTMLKE